EERAHYAEALRLRGWLLDLRGMPDAAEASLRESVDVARAQGARSWELRAATTLARLLMSQDRREEALALLTPAYDWFTEGRDTKDLMTAAQVLHELHGSEDRPVRLR